MLKEVNEALPDKAAQKLRNIFSPSFVLSRHPVTLQILIQ